MKILFTHRYFWPDTAPYAVLLRTIAAHAATQDHDVHVFASKPSYRGSSVQGPLEENIDGISVRRTWVMDEQSRNPVVRVINVVLYVAALFLYILRLRPDVVTAGSFPPVVAAWTASLAAKWVGAKFIYHCQDIHPEVSMYSGGRMGRGIIFKLFMWLDNQTLRRSAAVVVLSDDMADTVRARGVEGVSLHVINNFLLDSFDADAEPPQEYRKDPSRVRAIFAGNLGRFQNLPDLADGVAACFDRHPELELMFLGDGAALPILKAKWGDHPQVRFAPFLPFAQAQHLIADADIGLVSLQKDIYRVAYPSKVLSYLGLGLPIFAMVEQDSNLASVLSTHGVGFGTQRHVPEHFQALIQNLPNKEAVKSFYDTSLSTEIALSAWLEVLRSLTEDDNGI